MRSLETRRYIRVFLFCTISVLIFSSWPAGADVALPGVIVDGDPWLFVPEISLEPVHGRIVHITLQDDKTPQKYDFDFDPQRQVLIRWRLGDYDESFESDFRMDGAELRRIGLVGGKRMHEYFFYRDAAGRLQSMVRYNNERVTGTIIEFYKFEYDGRGQVKRLNLDVESGGDATERYDEIWVRDTRGRVTSRHIAETYEGKVEYRNTHNYSYNATESLQQEIDSWEYSSGPTRFSQMATISSHEFRTEYSDYKCDAHGNWIQRKVTSGTGERTQAVVRRIIAYADDGTKPKPVLRNSP